MNSSEIGKGKKVLRILSMVNAGIWAIALIALVVLLEKGGNLKGMYVILAGGAAVSIQLIAGISKLK